MTDWQVKVETILVGLAKDVEFIKEKLEPCEKEKLKGMIRSNRWVMGVLFSSIMALMGVIFTKI